MSETNIEEAERVKQEANDLFQKGKFALAISKYDEAIALNPNNAIYYANRAFANSKVEQFGSAIADAKKAIEIDKMYAKAYYRLGSAEIALGKYKEALKSFRQVTKIYPNNKEAKEKLQLCDKIVKKIAFEAAIEVQEVPVSETIDLSAYDVDNSYDGPRIPEEGINLEFVKALLEYQKQQKKLHARYVFMILLEIKKLLSSLPTLIEIEVPKDQTFNVCGDVHGQYYDLLNIFNINGLPSESNPYLFNGDFVDRGSFSVEVILSLFALKLLYPNHMHLLRGNHETLSMNNIYGFRGEVEAKYGKKAFELFNEVFCWLPLSAVLNNKVIIVHGGLFSKDGVKLNDIKNINRNRQPPDDGSIFSDLLWSDPQPFPGRSPSKRGVGVSFGPDVTHKFLDDNGLKLVVRSHEVKDEGYLVEADGRLITVFSAPNYCDQAGNLGAIIKFDHEMNPKFITFKAVDHPKVPPMAYSNQLMSGLI